MWVSFMAIHLKGCRYFSVKTKHGNHERKSHGIIKLIGIHLLVTMNVWTKFHVVNEMFQFGLKRWTDRNKLKMLKPHVLSHFITQLPVSTNSKMSS